MDMQIPDKGPVKVVVVSKTPAYAIVLGVFALIASILAFLIPILGTIILTPIAILFGILALLAGAKGIGVASFLILAVKLAISPTFWVNLWIGANQAEAGSNRLLSWIIVIGMLMMFVLLFKKSKS